MTPDSWSLRPYREGDEAGIDALIARIRPDSTPPLPWRWKYRPRGTEAPQVWVGVDGGEQIVFHYGAVARTLDSDQGRHPGLLAFDALTDPGYRRRGLFSAAMERAHAAWAQAGFACILGLPNEQWGSRVEAFDWRELFPLRWQIRPLRPEAILAGRLGIPALARLTVLGRLASRTSHHPDPSWTTDAESPSSSEVAALWQACLDEGKIGLARSREWLEDRFLGRPGGPYRILTARHQGRLAGYLVYRFDADRQFGFVAEVLTRPSDRAARSLLLRRCVEELVRRQAVAVAALAVPGTELAASQRRAGFLFSWGDFTVRCVPLAPELPFAALRNPRRWWLCGGDFDVI